VKIYKIFTERMSAGAFGAENKVAKTDRKRRSAEMEKNKLKKTALAQDKGNNKIA
jgi:hypothetical protein